MAIATDQATTTSYADIVRTTKAATPGSDTPALVEAVGVITGDTGYFQVTYASGRQETFRVSMDGQPVSLALMGNPNLNPITVVQVKGDVGGGIACVNALRYV